MEIRSECIKLRKKGNSYREISKQAGIPLSTVFLWTRSIILSKQQIDINKQKSLDKLRQSQKKAYLRRKSNYLQKNKLNQNIGLTMIDNINHQNINGIIGALYWGEGFKKDRRLGLANSDPQIIRLFLYWLINIAKVPIKQIRLRVGINFVFKNRIGNINKYWSGITNIPLSQFQKPFYQNVKIKRIYPNSDNYYGVLRIRANGQNETFQKLLGMIEKLKQETRRLEIYDID